MVDERRVTAANMRAYGFTVQYVPASGDAFDAVVIRRSQPVEQPTQDTFFADVEIDPEQIISPKRKDEVVWTDGERFVVAKVHQVANANPILSLHRKNDKRSAA